MKGEGGMGVGVCFYGRREGEKERRGDGKDTGVLMLMCWDNPTPASRQEA